jgi:hypothetical protein
MALFFISRANCVLFEALALGVTPSTTMLRMMMARAIQWS